MRSVEIYRVVGAAVMVTGIFLLVAWSCLDKVRAQRVAHEHNDNCEDYDYERGCYVYRCGGES